MKRKALLCSVPLLLALVLATGAAFAGPAPLPQTPQPAVAAPACEAQAPAFAVAVAEAAQAPAPLELFMPGSQQAATCPLIGCVDDQYCRRDRDCTAAPGGTCNLFCPTRGCCAYP